MKKILNIICAINLSAIISTSVSACSEKYLTITFQDLNNDEENEARAFDYMYKLPKAQQPHLNRRDFGAWNWRRTDDFTLRGTVDGIVSNPIDQEHATEYWTIDLRKTVDKGLFVWYWQENPYNPW